MNYIGSKFKLSHFLQTSIESTLQKAHTKPLKDSIFCDMFDGTAVVGRLLKHKSSRLSATIRNIIALSWHKIISAIIKN